MECVAAKELILKHGITPHLFSPNRNSVYVRKYVGFKAQLKDLKKLSVNFHKG
jgi:hypothetical protein